MAIQSEAKEMLWKKTHVSKLNEVKEEEEKEKTRKNVIFWMTMATYSIFNLIPLKSHTPHSTIHTRMINVLHISQYFEKSVLFWFFFSFRLELIHSKMLQNSDFVANCHFN